MKLTRFLAFFGVMALFGGCAAQPAPAGYTSITMEEASARLEAETDFILLDVRTEEEYGEAHIPGAICVPNETIGDEDVPQLPDKAQLIFVYCRSGNRSKQAAQKLSDMGYTNIVEIGGIIDWPGELVSP